MEAKHECKASKDILNLALGNVLTVGLRTKSSDMYTYIHICLTFQNCVTF